MQAPVRSQTEDDSTGGTHQPVSGGGSGASPPSPRRFRSPALAVQSILNPSDTAAESSHQTSWEPRQSPASATTASPTGRPPSSSSPIIPPPPRPGLQSPSDGPYATVPRPPVARPRLTPKSPAARAASFGARGLSQGTIPAAQVPFLGPPQPDLYPGERHRASIGSGVGVSAAPGPFHYGGSPVSGTLVSPEQQLYTGPPGSRPHYQGDLSPSTPHSAYSPFGQMSPSSAQGYLTHVPPTQPPPPPPPPPPLQPYPHAPPFPQANRPAGEPGGPYFPPEGGGAATPGAGGQPLSMFPVAVDMVSGSRKADTRRKKNRSASKSSRQRQKAAAEQKREEEMQALVGEKDHMREERDFYRAERDFFRNELFSRVTVSNAQIQRPPSPRHRHQHQIPEEGGGGGRPGETEESGRNVRPRIGPAPGPGRGRGRGRGMGAGPTIIPQPPLPATYQLSSAYMPTPASPYYPAPPAETPWEHPSTRAHSAPSIVPQPHPQPTTHPPPPPAPPAPTQEQPLPPRSQSPRGSRG